MKESVLDVLMYLFDSFIETDADTEPDRHLLRSELEQAGFTEQYIDRAFDWLDGLNEADCELTDAPDAMRVFTDSEARRLGVDAVGYVLHLEQLGILAPGQRELVVDRLMALGDADIDVEQVKWIVLIVLFSQPDQTAYARMENLVFETRPADLH